MVCEDTMDKWVRGNYITDVKDRLFYDWRELCIFAVEWNQTDGKSENQDDEVPLRRKAEINKQTRYQRQEVAVWSVKAKGEGR